MADGDKHVLEDQGTRLSVVIRNAVGLVAAASVIGGIGISGVLSGERWGDLVFGIGVGFLIAGGWLGMDAVRLRDKDVPSLIAK